MNTQLCEHHGMLWISKICKAFKLKGRGICTEVLSLLKFDCNNYEECNSLLPVYTGH